MFCSIKLGKLWREGGMGGSDPSQGGACTLSEGSLSCPDEGDLVGVHHVMGTILQHEAHPGDAVSRHQPLLTGIPEPLGTTAQSHLQNLQPLNTSL